MYQSTPASEALSGQCGGWGGDGCALYAFLYCPTRVISRDFGLPERRMGREEILSLEKVGRMWPARRINWGGIGARVGCCNARRDLLRRRGGMLL